MSVCLSLSFPHNIATLLKVQFCFWEFLEASRGVFGTLKQTSGSVQMVRDARDRSFHCLSRPCSKPRPFQQGRLGDALLACLAGLPAGPRPEALLAALADAATLEEHGDFVDLCVEWWGSASVCMLFTHLMPLPSLQPHQERRHCGIYRCAPTKSKFCGEYCILLYPHSPWQGQALGVELEEDEEETGQEPDTSQLVS
jgi:hypothetical protein